MNLLILTDTVASRAAKLPTVSRCPVSHAQHRVSGLSDATKTWATATTITGSGTKTVTIWNGGIAGETRQYFTDAACRETVIVTPKTALMLISMVHNENNTRAMAD